MGHPKYEFLLGDPIPESFGEKEIERQTTDACDSTKIFGLLISSSRAN